MKTHPSIRRRRALARCGAVTAAVLFAACAAVQPTIHGRQLDADALPPPPPPSIFDGVETAPPPAPPPAPEVDADATSGPPRIAGDELRSLQFRDVSLKQAVSLIAEEAGVNLYLDPDLDARVSAFFPSATYDQALQVLLERNGLRLEEGPEGFFWISRHDGSAPETGEYRLQAANAVELTENLRALLGDEARVVADAARNLIVVHGTRDEQEIARRFVRSADHRRQQVLIEVRILEVSLDESHEFGITGSLAGQIEGGTAEILSNLGNEDSAWELSFLSDSGKADAAIQVLSQYVGVNIVSSPRVLTTSTVEALIEVVREVPYVNVTETTSGSTTGVGSQTVEEVLFKEAGVTMKVTPIIQEGGILHIRIDKEFSEVIDFFNEIPVLDKRHLTSEFLVQDRETIVLGGLMQDRTRTDDSGVPLLMDVPLIGALFRRDEDVVEKRELLVFLTPRIVPVEENGSLSRQVQSHYQERLRRGGVPAVTETGGR